MSLNQEFCINCGSKNTFEVTRPKFCCGCGQPFNRTSKQSESSNVSPSNEETDELSKIRNLKEELKGNATYKASYSSISLDELWSNPLNPAHKSSIDRRGGHAEGQELLDQIAKECGSSRDNPTIIE